uniref:Uncharacterized protein n=1 Tax=Anguilla anguilla TaxID=7936 RepID=A0A0E9RXL3_ANGAN
MQHMALICHCAVIILHNIILTYGESPYGIINMSKLSV